MKPPTRRRAAPRRYETPEAGNPRLVWTTREKKELLQGLKTQLSERAPEVTVQGRSDEEVGGSDEPWISLVPVGVTLLVKGRSSFILSETTPFRMHPPPPLPPPGGVITSAADT